MSSGSIEGRAISLYKACSFSRIRRQLCEEVELHVAYRWFCRLDLEDKTPVTRRSRAPWWHAKLPLGSPAVWCWPILSGSILLQRYTSRLCSWRFCWGFVYLLTRADLTWSNITGAGVPVRCVDPGGALLPAAGADSRGLHSESAILAVVAKGIDIDPAIGPGITIAKQRSRKEHSVRGAARGGRKAAFTLLTRHSTFQSNRADEDGTDQTES